MEAAILETLTCPECGPSVGKFGNGGVPRCAACRKKELPADPAAEPKGALVVLRYLSEWGRGQSALHISWIVEEANEVLKKEEANR